MVSLGRKKSDSGYCCRKYDLKGSTVDREASDKEKEKDLPTLKDNDFVKDGTKVVIGDEAKERLMETLTADVEFLMKLQMMDYSLLLGVHDCEQAEQDHLEHPERKYKYQRMYQHSKFQLGVFDFLKLRLL